MQTEIHFFQAEKLSINHREQVRENAKEKLIEFMEQDYLMLDSRDFEYYSDETGIPIESLADIAIGEEMRRADEKRELTESLVKIKHHTGIFKYNPFRKAFFVHCEYLHRWREARLFELKTALN
jgi:hypothetical protein